MRINKPNEELVRTRIQKEKKECPQSIWIASDTIISELLDNSLLRAGFMEALSKNCERFLFIPWRQWPDPGKKTVEIIEKTLQRLPRSARCFRVFVVPDEIAALCMEYRTLNDGTTDFIYGHLIYSDADILPTVKHLRESIEMIEKMFKNTGAQASIHGIARCY